jgi:hypothetical protein
VSVMDERPPPSTSKHWALIASCLILVAVLYTIGNFIHTHRALGAYQNLGLREEIRASLYLGMFPSLILLGGALSTSRVRPASRWQSRIIVALAVVFGLAGLYHAFDPLNALNLTAEPTIADRLAGICEGVIAFALSIVSIVWTRKGHTAV